MKMIKDGGTKIVTNEAVKKELLKAGWAEVKEPKEPKTEFTVVLGNCQVAKFKADLTEDQAMILFNISSKEETHIDADGMLEFHCKERDMMIYSNIKA